MKIYRIQDRDGRGPFKPGFSKEWCDDNFTGGRIALPTWMEEFGPDAIDRLAHQDERYFGSAVRTMKQLAAWFSPTECQRLADFGYQVAAIQGGRIMAESKYQLLIARHTSFATNCLIIPWSIIERAAA